MRIMSFHLRHFLLKDELFKLALSLGGTLSGEHGIGYEKKKYLKDALDPKAIEYMEIRRVGYVATLQCVVNQVG